MSLIGRGRTPAAEPGKGESLQQGTAFVVVLGACTLGALMRRKTVNAPFLSRVRVLLPSYRFFEDIAPIPALFVKCVASPADEDDTPYVRALWPAPARRLRQVLWNPEGNLHLAHGSLLERLISELADADITAIADAEALTSYRMVAVLAREEAVRLGLRGNYLQFKLRYGDPEEDVLVSALQPRDAGAGC
ncbi:MAG: hypothetical protein RL385_2571 [Pseudomonadota bacterium]